MPAPRRQGVQQLDGSMQVRRRQVRVQPHRRRLVADRLLDAPRVGPGNLARVAPRESSARCQQPKRRTVLSLPLHAFTIAMTLLAVSPSAVRAAAIETRRISFAPGTSSATVKGSISGDKTVDYTVRAKAGQTMSVMLKTSNPSNYFNVLPPGSNDVAVFVGSSGGNEWTGPLAADGEHTIRVYLMRSAARRNEHAVTRWPRSSPCSSRCRGAFCCDSGAIPGAMARGGAARCRHGAEHLAALAPSGPVARATRPGNQAVSIVPPRHGRLATLVGPLPADRAGRNAKPEQTSDVQDRRRLDPSQSCQRTSRGLGLSAKPRHGRSSRSDCREAARCRRDPVWRQHPRSPPIPSANANRARHPVWRASELPCRRTTSSNVARFRSTTSGVGRYAERASRPPPIQPGAATGGNPRVRELPPSCDSLRFSRRDAESSEVAAGAAAGAPWFRPGAANDAGSTQPSAWRRRLTAGQLGCAQAKRRAAHASNLDML